MKISKQQLQEQLIKLQSEYQADNLRYSQRKNIMRMSIAELQMEITNIQKELEKRAKRLKQDEERRIFLSTNEGQKIVEELNNKLSAAIASAKAITTNYTEKAQSIIQNVIGKDWMIQRFDNMRIVLQLFRNGEQPFAADFEIQIPEKYDIESNSKIFGDIEFSTGTSGSFSVDSTQWEKYIAFGKLISSDETLINKLKDLMIKENRASHESYAIIKSIRLKLENPQEL